MQEYLARDPDRCARAFIESGVNPVLDARHGVVPDRFWDELVARPYPWRRWPKPPTAASPSGLRNELSIDFPARGSLGTRGALQLFGPVDDDGELLA